MNQRRTIDARAVTGVDRSHSGRWPLVTPIVQSANVTARTLQEWARTQRGTPSTRVSVTEAQLDTPYRPGGWSLRQVVHHLADSHAIGLVRFKLALTEDCPHVNKYNQEPFALLPDAALPPDIAVQTPSIPGGARF